MKQIAFKGRLLLRKILTALSIGAVAFTFQACYGVPMASVTGTVKDANTKKPIKGILISTDGNDYHELTDSEGWFEFYIDSWSSGNILHFNDVDGPENGEFQDRVITVPEKFDKHLTVLLNRKQ